MFPKILALLPALALASGLALGTGSGERQSAKWPPFSYVHPARPLPAVRPGERIMLTVESPGHSLALTRAQLLALPTVRYATEHAQLHRTFTYEGVPLRDLAVMAGFAGRDMRLYASNGFVTTIRARDYIRAPIMLAHTANGKPIPVLEKGPLTVVLPHDPGRFPPRLYGAAWVWFVERITPAP